MFKKLLITALITCSSTAIAASGVPDQLPCTDQSAEMIAIGVASAMSANIEDACRNQKGKKAIAECRVQVAEDYLGYFMHINELDYPTALATAKHAVKLSKEQKDESKKWYYNGFGRIFDTTIDAKGCFISTIAAYEAVRSVGGVYYAELEELK